MLKYRFGIKPWAYTSTFKIQYLTFDILSGTTYTKLKAFSFSSGSIS